MIVDEVAQTNNALIYPALGLGAILARSRTISPSMLMAGVHALASLSPALHNPEASLLPDLADVRSVSVHVAAAVVRQAVEDKNATDDETIAVVQGKAEQGLEDYIKVSPQRCVVQGEREEECQLMPKCRAACGTQCTGPSSWSISHSQVYDTIWISPGCKARMPHASVCDTAPRRTRPVCKPVENAIEALAARSANRRLASVMWLGDTYKCGQLRQ